MSTSIEELRILIKESLKEFQTNIAGGAGRPIHAFTIPNEQPVSGGTDIPPEPADIATAIVVAVKRLVNPVEDKEGQAALEVEVQRSRRVLADWIKHEDALNAAAEIAAETLVNSLDPNTYPS
mgnify:CR=1 FL=1